MTDKKKFLIAMKENIHKRLRVVAAESGVHVGDVVTSYVKIIDERVNAARKDGTIPENVRASFLDLAQLLILKDAGLLSEQSFNNEMRELMPNPGDTEWTSGN